MIIGHNGESYDSREQMLAEYREHLALLEGAIALNAQRGNWGIVAAQRVEAKSLLSVMNAPVIHRMFVELADGTTRKVDVNAFDYGQAKTISHDLVTRAGFSVVSISEHPMEVAAQ